MKVRHLMQQLTDLSRRGFGDDLVQVEVNGQGTVGVPSRLQADVGGVVLVIGEDEDEDE